MNASTNKRIGLALGGGSARGWAHIGVLHELTALGIRPDVVCGTSIGAFVGAAYVSGNLKMLDEWARSLNTRDIIRYLDFKFMATGGLADGRRLIDYFTERVGDPCIQELPISFCAVASELDTGNEIWIKDGSLWSAVRASMALPGLLTPVKLDDRWLVDGSLVNPVPVLACKTLGADTVIAINLNNDFIVRRSKPGHVPIEGALGDEIESGLLEKLSGNVKEWLQPYVTHWLERNDDSPRLLDVFANSLDIMQDRITRSRLAGDPPDVIIAPRIGHIGLFEFGRAAEAIEIGRTSVQMMAPALEDAVGGVGSEAPTTESLS